MAHKKPVVLVVLDGFGYSSHTQNNAIAQSNTPHLTAWLNEYPHCLLQASGRAVGLPDGMIGNSEVGHLTIGAGRIVEQPLTIIHRAIQDGSFFNNPILLAQYAALKQAGKPLHLMGLLSDAGVHSHQELLYALIKAAVDAGITDIIVHPFLDGRDVAPQSAEHYLQELERYLTDIGHGSIGSLHGRFYAMDRDQHWDRTSKSYATLTQAQPQQYRHWRDVITQSYAQGIFDEFIIPVQLSPRAVITPGSGVVFFNFRPDRARQLTAACIEPTFTACARTYIPLSFFMTPVSYGTNYPTTTLFDISPVQHTLKDVLCAHHKTMLAIAETEKYAHVTYFFAGGREKIFDHEVRILIPSVVTSNVAHYPTMSATLITQAVIKSLRKSPKDFYLINYANADMVGHTGNIEATIKAVQCLDAELAQLYHVVVETMGGTLYITADHGKAEQMFDAQSGQPCTAHTTNAVPFIMLRSDLKNNTEPLPLTELADIAPWILQQMELPVPAEMHK